MVPMIGKISKVEIRVQDELLRLQEDHPLSIHWDQLERGREE